MVTNRFNQAHTGVTSQPLLALIARALKGVFMQSLTKLFSLAVNLPKWAITFNFRVKVMPRTYGIYLEYGKEMEFREDFESPEAALWWAECRVRTCDFVRTRDIAVTICETTGGQWKLVETCSIGICHFVSVTRPEPKF